MESLKALAWRAVQEIKFFELRYKGQSTVDLETWLRNIIVFIPKRKGIDRLEQTRGICVQSSWPSGVVDVSDADFWDPALRCLPGILYHRVVQQINVSLKV